MPNILVTNDDGIYSSGILALWKAMKEIGTVTVVAPKTEKSAASHSITISEPIRIEKCKSSDGLEGYGIYGTPADCVKIAVNVLCEQLPDIVVSGINSGENVGNNIIYSGTVSAATEGTIYNIPSAAFSLASKKNNDYSYCSIITKKIVNSILKNGLPKGTLLNVNVPPLAEEEIKGIRITKQGKTYFKDKFEKKGDSFGRQFYSMRGESINPCNTSDFDSTVLNDGYVSITPLHYKLTDTNFLSQLNKWEIL